VRVKSVLIALLGLGHAVVPLVGVPAQQRCVVAKLAIFIVANARMLERQED